MEHSLVKRVAIKRCAGGGLTGCMGEMMYEMGGVVKL
jgi:hypothetical protein